MRIRFHDNYIYKNVSSNDRIEIINLDILGHCHWMEAFEVATKEVYVKVKKKYDPKCKDTEF